MCTYSDSGVSPALRAAPCTRGLQRLFVVGRPEGLDEAIRGRVRGVARARRVESAQQFGGDDRVARESGSIHRCRTVPRHRRRRLDMRQAIPPPRQIAHTSPHGKSQIRSASRGRPVGHAADAAQHAQRRADPCPGAQGRVLELQPARAVPAGGVERHRHAAPGLAGRDAAHTASRRGALQRRRIIQVAVRGAHRLLQDPRHRRGRPGPGHRLPDGRRVAGLRRHRHRDTTPATPSRSRTRRSA